MRYILTAEGKAKTQLYIEQIAAEREAILDAKLDTAYETDPLTEADVLEDIEITTVGDDGVYNGFFGVTDNRLASKVLTLNENVDFVEA